MGGLARRASKIDSFRRPDQGLIIIDTGDSLAERGSAMNLPAEQLRPRAGTMIRALGHMGADGLVPGELELATGPGWLAKEAGHAGLPLLAANMRPARGKNPFKARKLVKAGDVKVGLFGLVDFTGEPDEALQRVKSTGVRIKPALAAGKAQVRALRKAGADLIVLLAHMPKASLDKLLERLKGIHLVIQGHQGMHTGQAIRQGDTFLMEAGRRGMHLGHAAVALGEEWKAGGETRLEDDSERRVMHLRITRQIGVLEQLLSTVDPGQPPPDTAVELNKQLQGILQEYEDMGKQVAPHTVAVEMIPLNSKVPDHPAVRALVKGQEAEQAAAPASRRVRAAVPAADLRELKPVRIDPEKIEEMEQNIRKMEEKARQEAR